MTGRPTSAGDLTSAEQPIVFIIDYDEPMRRALTNLFLCARAAKGFHRIRHCRLVAAALTSNACGMTGMTNFEDRPPPAIGAYWVKWRC